MKIWINSFHLLLEYELKKSLASSTHKYEKDYYSVQWTLAHTYIKTLKRKVGHTLIIKTHWLVQENILLPFKLLFLQLQNSFIKRDNTYVIICQRGSAWCSITLLTQLLFKGTLLKWKYTYRDLLSRTDSKEKSQ